MGIKKTIKKMSEGGYMMVKKSAPVRVLSDIISYTKRVDEGSKAAGYEAARQKIKLAQQKGQKMTDKQVENTKRILKGY